MNNFANILLSPQRLWSRFEILSSDCPIPRRPGVYAWFFKDIPPGVPIEGCCTFDSLNLLYIGISPTAPPTNGAPSSRQTLRSRLQYHFRGNAEGSTLRLTLGCLLSKKLDIQLRRVGSGKRMTFTTLGEEKLSDWMAANAYVCWIEVDEPWKLEDQLIRTLPLPLNLRGNPNHAFHPTLSDIRRKAKIIAKQLPIVAR